MKPQMKRMLNSGGNVSLGGTANNKRSVSETKKKYVASQQAWKCKHCSDMLDATFEVDHVVDLQFGGSNNVTNLVAIRQHCHNQKTCLESSPCTLEDKNPLQSRVNRDPATLRSFGQSVIQIPIY